MQASWSILGSCINITTTQRVIWGYIQITEIIRLSPPCSDFIEHMEAVHSPTSSICSHIQQGWAWINWWTMVYVKPGWFVGSSTTIWVIVVLVTHQQTDLVYRMPSKLLLSYCCNNMSSKQIQEASLLQAEMACWNLMKCTDGWNLVDAS